MRPALRVLPALVVVAVLVCLALLGYQASWTGFPTHKGPDGKLLPPRLLWDWLDLLIVPVFLAIGAWLLDGSRRKSDQQVETDRQRQKTLEDYLTCMTDLLLKGSLRGPNADNSARAIARNRTLAALRVLDGGRKAQLLQFVYESGLINQGSPDLVLNGADFSDAKLDEAVLRGSDLRGVHFQRASFRRANLQDADLRASNFDRANLRNAHLHRANLVQASLRMADLTGADLSEASVGQVDLTKAKTSRAKLYKS